MRSPFLKFEIEINKPVSNFFETGNKDYYPRYHSNCTEVPLCELKQALCFNAAIRKTLLALALGASARKGWELKGVAVGFTPSPTLWEHSSMSVFVIAFFNYGMIIAPKGAFVKSFLKISFSQASKPKRRAALRQRTASLSSSVSESLSNLPSSSPISHMGKSVANITRSAPNLRTISVAFSGERA